MNLDAARIHESLRRLRSAGSHDSGAEGHDFSLNPPLTDVEVGTFEHLYGVRLQSDYRFFLTEVGNGGAGPGYGVFPLGMMDDGFNLKAWREKDGAVGILSKPFPFEADWNDLTGKPSDEMLAADPDRFDRMTEEFEARYWWDWRLANGAIPICHVGCAIRIWLVLTGNQAGRLWRDARAEFKGLMPVRLADGSAATFASWYEEWLGKALRESGLA